jgi:hypothetical protein
MHCAFVELVIRSARRWFASDRSLPSLAPIELEWLERGLQPAWPACALFLSIVDFERTRELEVGAPAPAGGPARRGIDHTLDERALATALALARHAPGAALPWLLSFLSPESARAAVRAAAHLDALAGESARSAARAAALADGARTTAVHVPLARSA